MAKILLTRSKQENLALREQLAPHDFTFIDLPLIVQKDLGFDFSLASSFEHIIITSKYAANIIPSNKYSQKALVVGFKSAEILENKGYEVEYLASNARELIDKLNKQNLTKAAYFSGNSITAEMPDFVERFIIYDTAYKKKLNEKEIAQIRNLTTTIIPIYSENCAKTLIKLLEDNDLANFVANTTIIAISLKVKNVLNNHFCNIVAAEKPSKIINKILEYAERKKPSKT